MHLRGYVGIDSGQGNETSKSSQPVSKVSATLTHGCDSPIQETQPNLASLTAAPHQMCYRAQMKKGWVLIAVMLSALSPLAGNSAEGVGTSDNAPCKAGVGDLN